VCVSTFSDSREARIVELKGLRNLIEHSIVMNTKRFRVRETSLRSYLNCYRELNCLNAVDLEVRGFMCIILSGRNMEAFLI